MARDDDQTADRWTDGVAGKVVAGIFLALLLWVGSAQVSQIRAQATTAQQVRSLTEQIRYLRSSLADVPKLRDRVSRLEVRQSSISRRVESIEGRFP